VGNLLDMDHLMNRRTLLTTLASLPLLGWLRPKEKAVDDLGGFIVPKEFESVIECDSYRTITGDPIRLPITRLTIEEVCELRGVEYEPQAPPQRPANKEVQDWFRQGDERSEEGQCSKVRR
jgi:hypothetical protein